MFAPAAAAPPPSRPESVNFDDLLQTIDAHFSHSATANFERFSFELDGLAIEVRRIPQDEEHRFLIAATVGHLPFSAESPERRHAVRTIVQAAHILPTVHFTIDACGKICAGGLFDQSQVVSPDFVFHPLMLFLQEARPFMRLIAHYIQG